MGSPPPAGSLAEAVRREARGGSIRAT